LSQPRRKDSDGRTQPLRKAGTRRNGVERGCETALPLTSRRVCWRDARSAGDGATERRSRNGCCKRKVLRQDGNPLPRNGAGQRRPAGSVRSMTADRTPGETALKDVISLSGSGKAVIKNTGSVIRPAAAKGKRVARQRRSPFLCRRPEGFARGQTMAGADSPAHRSDGWRQCARIVAGHDVVYLFHQVRPRKRDVRGAFFEGADREVSACQYFAEIRRAGINKIGQLHAL